MSDFLLRTRNCEIKYEHYFPNELVDEVRINTGDQHLISAWFISKDTSKAVILAPGKGQNRLAMINKARYYLKRNYSVLMPDLRATGNSEGEYNSLGYYERFDIEACCDFLKKNNFKTVGAQGHSLGAAAIVYTTLEKYKFDFLILESCYDNMQHAFEDRVHLFYLPAFLFKPVCWFGEAKIDVGLDKLNPQQLVKNIKTPVLFLYGDSEWQLPLAESEALFEACGSGYKMKHVFTHGAHEDFSIRYKKEFEQSLDSFLEKYAID